MASEYKHVFEPITIRGVYYKNRVELAPPGCGGGGDANGIPTKAFVEYFRPFAKNGVGIITVGNCSIDRSECFDEDGQLDMSKDAVVGPLSRFADMCSKYGAVAQLEINHNGATQGNHTTATPGQPHYSASEIITEAERVRAALEGRDPVPTVAMDKQKIEETIQKYADAALRAKKAGMRAVMLHGAHGNLLPQFFSPYFNKRRDEYGGSIHNRARFAVEVLDAVRSAVGEDVVLEYRISADEFYPGHTHFDENLQFIDIIKEKIDILHVSGGLHDTQGQPWVMRPMVQPYTMEQMYNVHWAADIKKTFPKMLVTTVGSIKNLKNAEEIIASGKADFVAFMRELMADPEMVKKYAENRPEDHRPCVRCACVYVDKYGQFSMPCTVNPIYGRYDEYPEGRVPTAPVKKKVAVVGGGPAGVQAMMTLLERGHDVTLYEKNDRIGGTLLLAGQLPFKNDVREYVNYLQTQCAKAQARILLNTEATPEALAEENYDAILVACGSKPIVPPVPGISGKNVLWAPEAEKDETLTGQRIVIVGAGSVGIECASYFGKLGKQVTLLEMAPTYNLRGATSGPLGGENCLLEWLNKYHVRQLYNSKMIAVSEAGVTYEDLLDGTEKMIEADTVLLAVGMKPQSDYGNSFRHCCPETELFLIGDCREVGEIRDATRSAFEIARMI